MTAADALEVGDIVFVGEPAPLTKKVTWRILFIRNEDGTDYAYLSSGMTDRARREPVSRLTRFRLMENA